MNPASHAFAIIKAVEDSPPRSGRLLIELDFFEHEITGAQVSLTSLDKKTPPVAANN